MIPMMATLDHMAGLPLPSPVQTSALKPAAKPTNGNGHGNGAAALALRAEGSFAGALLDLSASAPEAQRLDAQGVRRDVDQDRPDVDAGDQPPLDRGAQRDGQVGLDLAVDRPAQPLLQEPVDQRGPGRPADQHHLIDLVGRHLAVGEGLVEVGQGLEQQRVDQLFELEPAALLRLRLHAFGIHAGSIFDFAAALTVFGTK